MQPFLRINKIEKNIFQKWTTNFFDFAKHFFRKRKNISFWGFRGSKDDAEEEIAADVSDDDMNPVVATRALDSEEEVSPVQANANAGEVDMDHGENDQDRNDVCAATLALDSEEEVNAVHAPDDNM